MAKIEKYTTGEGTEIAIRFRWTTVEGERGVVWEWTEWTNRDGNASVWSDPNGPCPSKADAREWAIDAIRFW